MDRKVAQEVLNIYGHPRIEMNNGGLSFSRQNIEDVMELEQMSDKDLIGHYKSLVFMNYIYGQVSISELQRIDLMDLELNERNIGQGLEEWYQEAVENFNIDDYLMEK